MSDEAIPPARILGPTVGFIATASLVGTGLAIILTIPSIGPGFYGGTALAIFFMILAQGVALLAGVALPVAVHAFRRRLQLSRLTWLLVVAAIVGVLVEIAAIHFIPITGAS